MADPQRYQVAIVGGGPAGLAAALAAAEAGARSIIIIERKRAWGRPVQCAGYVPRLIGRLLPKIVVRARVETLELYLDGERLAAPAAPGFILKRDAQERLLAEGAKVAGVECLQPARVVEVREGGELLVEAAGEGAALRAEVVIGADGPTSLVRKAMGLPPNPLALGLEYDLPAKPPLPAPQIHFSHAYGAGYAWVFPHEESVGVGLALDGASASGLRRMLDQFVERRAAGWARGGGVERVRTDGMDGMDGMDKMDESPAPAAAHARPLGVVTGPIPVGGPPERTVAGRFLLVGDAAGQTNPLTGAGLCSAVACGEMAGRAAAKAVLASDLSLLLKYESEWRDLFGLALERASRARESMAASPPEEFRERVVRAWGLKRSSRK
ncbi:MAG: NAD(P)/FAD-dependent oxidoreductase [Candidatus Sumerlaeota bacterium]|nr:NAD(P)/FAD-dependent oxidoreductase [Candidatus Sumerlaeota bacterium]